MATRQKLVAELPLTGEIVRGSLIERTVRHRSGCTICAGGGGHPLWVLTIGYPGGRTASSACAANKLARCVAGWAITTS